MHFPPLHRQATRLRGAVALLSAALLAGCAVQPNGRGGLLVGVDNAQLFGTTIATFRLGDGAEGALRRDPNNGAFSIKLADNLRVVPLPAAAQSARLARLVTIGPRTILVVETQERHCPFRYEVLSIAGADVLHWSLGTCQDRPRMVLTEGGTALYFDFPARGQLQRHIYIDGRMLNAGYIPAPGINFTQRPFADADLRAPDGIAMPLPPRPPVSPVSPVSPALPPRQSAPAPAAARPEGAAGTPAVAARVIPPPPHKADAPVASSASASTTTTAPGRKPSAKDSAAQTPPPMKMPTEETKVIHLDLRQ